MKYGARNNVTATVGSVTKGDVMSLVKFDVQKPAEMASVLTTESLEDLDLKPGDEVLANPLVPTTFTLDVLVEAWNDGRLGRYLFNSFVVALVVTIAQVVTSVLAAYAFAILEFPETAFQIGDTLTALGKFR